MKTIVYACGLLVLSVYASGSACLLNQSKFWPNMVTVNVDVTGVTHGNTVKSGKEWTFLRYEGEKCLVDMGHNGIHTLNIEDTDVLARVVKNAEERTFPYQGLFTHRYTKSFFDPKTLRGLQHQDLDAFDYFLLCYFDYQSGSSISHTLGNFVKNHKMKTAKEMKLAVLLLPSKNVIEDNLVSDYISDGFDAPTATPFMLEGMMHTLQHQHETKGDLVLIDKNGKIINQFFLSSFSEDHEISEAIKLKN